MDIDIRNGILKLKKERDAVEPGTLITVLKGITRNILLGERTALNFLQWSPWSRDRYHHAGQYGYWNNKKSSKNY